MNGLGQTGHDFRTSTDSGSTLTLLYSQDPLLFFPPGQRFISWMLELDRSLS